MNGLKSRSLLSLVVCLVLQASLPARAGSARLHLVTDSPYEIWRGSTTKVQVVVFGPRFRPVAGATVFAGSRRVGVTDRDGTLVFSHRPRGGFTLSARARLGGREAYGSVHMEAYRRTGSFESSNLFVYTDRGIYRPGETIHLRSLAWRLRGEFRPISGARLEVLLQDPGGRVVAGTALQTDPFGVAAGELDLPGDVAEGAYLLSVNYHGASEQARLRVERFRPPVIRIEHDLPRFIAPATADLQATVKLSYFTGGRPRGGRLSLRVLYADKQLHGTQVPISGQASYRLVVPLAPVRKAVPAGERFQVEISARDELSRHDRLVRDILYAARPYLAVPDLDKDVYASGEEVTLTVRLTDPDGIPVRGKRLELSGDDGRIKLTAVSDPGGVVLFRFTMPDHGIKVRVSAADVPEPLFHSDIPYLEQKPLRAHLPRPVVTEHRRIPIVVTFDEDFVPVERVVHGDITDYSGAITAGFKVRIRRKHGRYLARGSFRAPSWGSMLLTLYCAGQRREEVRHGRRPASVGLLTEGLSLTAHPDKQLRIKLDGVPDWARPRDRLQARFAVRDPRGRPTTAELGVMLVDRAVLSLLDPLEKTPMDRFYNPTLKVLSTTGSDILTWPVVSRNWGASLYDIALPPFGFQEGAPYYRHRRRYQAGGGPPAEKTMDGGVGSGQLSGSAIVKAPAAAPQREAVASRALARGRPGRPSPSRPRPPRIVIRTDLPATALWEPRLVAYRGRAALEIKLPETLGQSELIVVASDRRGGVGLLRRVVKLTQPLLVQSDLPRVASAGDRLQVGVLVRNTTGDKLTAEVSLEGEGLGIHPARRQVEIPARGATRANFTISPGEPGPHHYTASARATVEISQRQPGQNVGGPTYQLADAERRLLEVRPRGNGRLEEVAAVLTGKRPFARTITRAPGEYLEAHLEVAFPTIVPALQEIGQLLDHSAWWSDGMLATSLAACAVEAYLARHRPRDPLRQRLRAYLAGMAGGLRHEINPDGGFAWWRTGSRSNLLATTTALRFMAALADADLAVPRELVVRSVEYLKTRLRPDGLWPIDDIAFWEGRTEKVRLQVSAQVFRALAEALPLLPGNQHRAWLSEVAGRFGKYLENPVDPLTAAEAALGLYAFESKGRRLPKQARRRLLAAARRLLELRRRSHWEPSWFHAYGGTIEATEAALELLARLDRRAFAAELRQGLLYLLSTRGEWGQWHCPFGTATALRAFTLLPPPRREVASRVVVKVGDKVIARVKVNPRDPFLSAVRLRHLQLGPYLQEGDNQVRVSYSGRLEAPLRLVVRRFGSGSARPQATAGLSVSRTLEPAAPRSGHPLQMHLAVDARKVPGELLLEVPLAANTGLDRDALDNLRRSPGVLAVRSKDDGLELLLQGGKERRLQVALLAGQGGRAELPAVQVRSLLRPELVASSTAGTVEIR